MSLGRDRSHSQSRAGALAQAPASERSTSDSKHHASCEKPHDSSLLPLTYEVDLEGMLRVRMPLITRKQVQTYNGRVEATFVLELESQRSSKDLPCLCSDPDRLSAMLAAALSLLMTLPS